MRVQSISFSGKTAHLVVNQSQGKTTASIRETNNSYNTEGYKGDIGAQNAIRESSYCQPKSQIEEIAPVINREGIDYKKVYYADKYEKLYQDSRRDYDYIVLPEGAYLSPFENYIDEMIREEQEFHELKYFC